MTVSSSKLVKGNSLLPCVAAAAAAELFTLFTRFTATSPQRFSRREQQQQRAFGRARAEMDLGVVEDAVPHPPPGGEEQGGVKAKDHKKERVKIVYK